MSRLAELLFGQNRTQHPLELDKETHREKQVELEAKRDSLTGRRDELQDHLDELQQRYMDAREAGDEDTAEEALREAERVEERLDTVQGKLDVVDQMLQTVSNFLNVYEMRELRGDQYWGRLMELDRDELVDMFSEEKVTIKQLTQRLDTAGTASSDVVSTFNESTSRLHGSSDLRDRWDEEFADERQSGKESLSDPEDVFEDLEGMETQEESSAEEELDLDEDDISDLRLS